MARFKLTKGELKRQRDGLKQYQRYLPTLQLKKQQLQMEILKERQILEEKSREKEKRRNAIEKWAGLLTDGEVTIGRWIKATKIVIDSRNVAGIELPLFVHAEFEKTEYDLFTTPLWVDRAIEELRGLVSLGKEEEVLKAGMEILKSELKVATQRVNLFEKVKIPEAEEAIRIIKIYLGDQMTNSVGRSKIAKRKIEEAEVGAVL